MNETMFTKDEARKLQNAKKVYNEALKNCDAEAAERAARVFEEIGATFLAIRARTFAESLTKQA